MNSTIAVTLLFSFFCILTMGVLAYFTRVQSKLNKEVEKHEKVHYHGIIETLNHNDFVNQIGSIIPHSEMEKMFNRAKNPWKMSIPTFQFIRYVGLVVGVVTGVLFLAAIPAVWQIGFLFLCCGILCWYYPSYYYKAIGDEREAEWNKMYEFVWVIKHNAMLYDVGKCYMNVKMYIEEHAPHDQELIQGFSDFYEYWDPDELSPYCQQYYPFSVPREITQILFNMNKTGQFPEQELNALRQFIINAQDLTVEKMLSQVSSKATIFSLPFLMITVIISLMIPMVWQLVGMF